MEAEALEMLMEPSKQNQLCFRMSCYDATNNTCFSVLISLTLCSTNANLHLCLILEQVSVSEVNPWLTVLHFIPHSFRDQSTGLNSCYLRLKPPSVNSIDIELSAPTCLFCWLGAAVIPNYHYLLPVFQSLKSWSCCYLSTQLQKEGCDVVLEVQQRRGSCSPPGFPAHLKTTFIRIHL